MGPSTQIRGTLHTSHILYLPIMAFWAMNLGPWTLWGSVELHYVLKKAGNMGSVTTASRNCKDI